MKPSDDKPREEIAVAWSEPRQMWTGQWYRVGTSTGVAVEPGVFQCPQCGTGMEIDPTAKPSAPRSSVTANEGKTPRTDAFAVALAKKMDGGYDDEWYDWTEYARQLERELAAALEELALTNGTLESRERNIDGLLETARSATARWKPDLKQCPYNGWPYPEREAWKAGYHNAMMDYTAFVQGEYVESPVKAAPHWSDDEGMQ